jgi:transglutaminase-like putative cysteine protease
MLTPLDAASPVPEPSRPALPPDAPLADLGLALFPASTPAREARTWQWRVESLAPPEHRIGYALSQSVARSLAQEHEAYGRTLRFRALGPDRFTYRAPPGCEADMRCIYAELMRSNAEPVRVLGERFVEHIHAQGLSAAEATELIATYVQRIRYQQPDEQPFGILPPALVPAEDRGDCDSKAVLAVMLLRQVGIEAVVLYSELLAHAAVGVAVPGRGHSFHQGGHTYRYVELCSEGWPVGMIPPQHDKPHLWKVLPPPELVLSGVD